MLLIGEIPAVAALYALYYYNSQACYLPTSAEMVGSSIASSYEQPCLGDILTSETS